MAGGWLVHFGQRAAHSRAETRLGVAPVQLVVALDFCAAEWPHHGVGRNLITTEPSRSRSQPLTRVIAGAIGQELHKPNCSQPTFPF